MEEKKELVNNIRYLQRPFKGNDPCVALKQ